MKVISKTVKENKKAIAHRSGTKIAKEVLKEFDNNSRIVGLTNGDFSLISLIEAVLEKTGKADIVISTWSAGLYDAGALNSLVASGLIRNVRLILDRSFKTRQSGYSIYLQDVFSEENIRTTNTHAKFVLIKNENWNVVILSSMNLNENKRCENFDVTNDLNIYEMFDKFVSDLFIEMPKGIIESRSKVDKVFDVLFGVENSTSKSDWYKVRE